MQNYHHANFEIEMKYRRVTDEDDSAEPTIIEVNSITSPEIDKKHNFDIQDYGQNAILIAEGEMIEVGLRLKSGNSEFSYIYSGYNYNYNEVEG